MKRDRSAAFRLIPRHPLLILTILTAVLAKNKKIRTNLVYTIFYDINLSVCVL